MFDLAVCLLPWRIDLPLSPLSQDLVIDTPTGTILQVSSFTYPPQNHGMAVVQSLQMTMMITRTRGEGPAGALRGTMRRRPWPTFLQSFAMLQPATFQGSRSCKRTTNLGYSFWVILKSEQSINLSLLRCFIRHKEWYLCEIAGSGAMIFPKLIPRRR